MNIDANDLNHAMAHHRAGRLEDAASGYQAVLARDPRRPDVLYLLGVLAYQTGSHEPAARFFRQALLSKPDYADCWNLLGLALAAQSDTIGAEESFRKAIALEKNADYFLNLGNVLKSANRAAEAAEAYREALRIHPHFAGAHYSLGNLHRLAGELEEAAKCFERAVEAEPTHGDSLAALGQTLNALRRPAEALPFLERAVLEFPSDAELMCDLGDSLAGLGHRAEGAACYARAIASEPQLARAWFAAGLLARDSHDFAEAAVKFGRAAQLQPEWAAAHYQLGDAFFHTGQVDEALAEFALAAAMGHGDTARGRAALIVPGSPTATNATILAVRQNWASHAVPNLVPKPLHQIPSRRLRIGYLSYLFHQTNWMKPIWGVVHAHDRENFQVHLFSDTPQQSIGEEYRRHADDVFHDISGLSNADAAQVIEQSGVDVLVDLNGFSAVWRLPVLGLRPAPVIVGWFNMFATSGMQSFDCLVGDAVVIPQEEEPFYTESIARVTGTYLAFEVGYPTPDVLPPPSLENSGRLVFGSLASLYKITSEVISTWSAILHQAPESVLLLKNASLETEGMRHFVHGRFEREGIARSRILLEGPADHDRFLQTYGSIDVALDPFPYSGGTTTSEALWQGVPVITYLGDRWAARTSASLMLAAGLGEFVAADRESYVSLAVALARDAATPARLHELRMNMRDRLRTSAACDTTGLTRQLERIYRQALEARLTAV